ncbi:MAG: PKD domain-containing protein [Candidatus Paceibacterota bacterium]|jgi:hypothetical protein
MKNIINTSKKAFVVTAISLLSVFVFSVPTYAHADVWSRLGNFFEDAWDDVSDVSASAWDHIEDEVEDWHIDMDWDNDYYHYNDYYSHGNYGGGHNYWDTSSCGSCGCNATTTCGGWNSTNGNVYGPNSYYDNGGNSGWNYNNGYNYTYNNYSSLNGSCAAGVSNTEVGGVVTWTASATGGNGFYTYYWTGDEGLSSNGQTAPKTYNTGGTKTANLTIVSNGQSITRTCTVNVNQVLAYTQTNPYVASVYLSDVPYTGAGDTMKVVLFTLSLILWSTTIAYFLLKKKEAQEVPVVIASENVISTEVHADTKAMSQIEDYARMNNIIISQGAVINLLKAKRLNDTNISETIRNVASSKTNSQGEWITISEGDLEKYI